MLKTADTYIYIYTDLDIDPKVVNDIKNAMDKLNSVDVEEELFGII